MDRKVDGLGRVTIPKEVRNQVGLNDNDFVDLFVEDGAIILKPKKKTVLDERRITKYSIDQKRVEMLREKYKKGDRVKLLNMRTEYYLVPQGTLGTVDIVDDIGSVHVKWDNGVNVAVLDITGDAIEHVKS